jgi:phosphohistidine phosphatase
MNLYVIRHGAAGAIGGSVQRDADRPLTDQGKSDALLLGRLLGRLDPLVQLILCSSYLRARQTAHAVVAGLPTPAPVQETDHLSPGFRPKPLLEELQALAPDRSAVVIGHQPDLSMFLAYVIDGESAASIAMAPGGIAKVKFDSGPTSDAELQWLLSPDVIRQFFPPR